jgi:hypothetical protein
VTAILDTAVDVRTRIPYELLDAALAGAVHTPGEPGYAEHVTPWIVSVQMDPDAVVAARTGADVAAAVRFAGEYGLTASVQATGHGATEGISGQLLISTKGLDECTVHPEGWARVGAGVKWLRVIEEAAPYGLAPLNGSTSDVGVVGYTTGGGVGPMARTFGIAADLVRAFDVVTGDGVLRRVTPTEHPDLFFALRGGKGAAGIVTAVEFDMVHLPTFYGGALYFDAADAAAVIDRWRSWSQLLPQEATTSFVLLQLPDMPGVPPQLAGRMTLGVRFLWTADPGEGARWLDQIRAVAPVLLDDAALKPYTAVDSVHADPVDPMPVIDPAILMRDFPAEAAERLLDAAGPASGSSLIMVEVRQLGGAYARSPEHPDAFSHRDAEFSVLTVGIAPDPRSMPDARRVFAALADWDTGTVWPNFGPIHDGTSARRAYDPQTLARLADVVRTYDPAGVIQHGRFIHEAV